VGVVEDQRVNHIRHGLHFIGKVDIGILGNAVAVVQQAVNHRQAAQGLFGLVRQRLVNLGGIHIGGVAAFRRDFDRAQKAAQAGHGVEGKIGVPAGVGDNFVAARVVSGEGFFGAGG